MAQQADSNSNSEWVAEPFEGDAAAVAQPAAPAEEWIAEPVDPEFDLKPDYANGLSPQAPINKSPLDVMDRFKMSFGNEAGNEEFLKKKFGNVQRDEDGNFLVQKDGLWHRADAKNLEDVDPWKVTKGVLKFGLALAQPGFAAANSKDLMEDDVSRELIGDAADLAKETVAINASLVAGGAGGTLAKGLANSSGVLGRALTNAGSLNILGQSLSAGSAGGAVALANTSLGRAAGTYEATPEQQAKDIAFETALNVLGTAIPLGVKPTGKWIGERIPVLAKAFNKLGDAQRAVIKNTWGRMSAGTDAWEVLEKDAAELSSAMKRYSQTAGDETFEQLAQVDSIKQVEKLSKLAPQIESRIYNKMSADIVRSTPDNFVSPLRETVADVYEEAATAGLGTLKVGGKTLSQQETLEAIAKGSLPADAKFVMKSQDQILKEMQASGAFNEFGDLATDKQAYRQVMAAFRQIDDLAKSKPLTGKEGARQLLDFQKLAGRITYTLKEQGRVEGNALTQSFAAKLNSKLKGRFTKAFDAYTPKTAEGKSLYTALLDEYSSSKKALDTLVSATKNKNNTKTAETFTNRVTSAGKRNVTEKQALRQLAATAERHGLPELQAINEAQRRLRVNEAALAFNPIVRPGLIGQSAMLGTAGSLAAGAAGAINPGTVAAGLGVGAATSPRLAYGLMQGKNFVNNLTKTQLEALRNNPEALMSLVQATTQTEAVQEGVKQQLLGGGQP